MEAETAWRLTVEGGLPLRYWDGNYVVYNPLTGNTHVLDIVTGEVLETIMAGRATSGELCRHVARFLDVPNDGQTAENVREILLALDVIGLIEPVTG
jgi:PqqD family protein of HPr-rel-A system